MDFQSKIEFSLSDEDILILEEMLVDSYREYERNVPCELWEKYEQELREVRVRLQDPNHVQCILRNSASLKIVGCVSLYKGAPEQHIQQFPPKTAYVRFLALSPTVRGKKLGTVLMKSIIAFAKDQGMEHLAS